MQESVETNTGDGTLDRVSKPLQDATNAAKWITIPKEELREAIWQGRRRLIHFAAAGIAIGTAVALLIPKEYTSTIELMPPNQQLLASTELGVNSVLSPSFGGLGNLQTPVGTTIGILNSRSAKDAIIRRFDLLQVYDCRYYADARKTLAARTKIQEDRPSGIVTVSIVDRDPHRAQAIAGAYIEVINSLLNSVNSSSARREREFLEGRLKSLKAELDATSTELSAYSSRNVTFNPQIQGQAALEAASRLQAELITAQSELDALESQYADENVRVKAARARVQELQTKLRQLGGAENEAPTENLGSGEVYPNLRQLPMFGVKYASLYRQLTMQEDIYAALMKQYELAKVQEEKDIPVIKVLDAPDFPERKSFPPRLLLIFSMTIGSVFCGCLWLAIARLMELPAKSKGAA